MLLTRDEIRFDFGGAQFELPRDRALLGWVFDQFLYGEVTGIQVGHWIHRAPNVESARFLARQCAQELAHIGLVRQIFDVLEVEPRPAHRWVRFLSTGLMGAGWEEHVCLEMALGEGYVLAVFYALIDTVPEPRIRRLLEVAARQEETHVAFGETQTRIAARSPRVRQHLLGMALLSLVVLRRLGVAAGRRLGADHPVCRQLPAFTAHVAAMSEIRLQRAGLLDAPLVTLSRLQRARLIAAGACGRALLPLRMARRPRLTSTYLQDPAIARSSVALRSSIP
ncbi:MAG TPA: ferritin-like domain-containing protein [Candidatus Krumholzibacteria bacterium]|nr:ferritin-like domain-containing protein [Candidatus Krumholzibacteria bacterium]